MILQNIVLIVAVAAPALLLILLRTNAAVVFFSLCAGAVLVRYTGHEADLASSALSNNAHLVTQYSQLFLLLLPVVLVALVLRKTVPATKMILNIVPAIAVGVVGVLLAVPLLSGGAHSALTNTTGWKLIENSQEFVVGVSVATSILALWLIKPGHDSKKKH